MVSDVLFCGSLMLKNVCLCGASKCCFKLDYDLNIFLMVSCKHTAEVGHGMKMPVLFVPTTVPTSAR